MKYILRIYPNIPQLEAKSTSGAWLCLWSLGALCALTSRRGLNWVYPYLDPRPSVFRLKVYKSQPWPFACHFLFWSQSERIGEGLLACCLVTSSTKGQLVTFSPKITFSLKRSAAAALLLKATHQCFSCLTWKGITGGNLRNIDYLIWSPIIHLPPRP